MLYTEKQKWFKERKSKEMGRNIGQDVFLSICIPTYNKGSRIAELIRYYLGQIPGEVELVAADDSSVDDTEALLNSIHDKRFYYYRNEKRLGYINMIRVLVGGGGKYCILVGDKDRLLFDTDWLEKLKDSVEKHKNPACILCNYGFSDKKDALLCIDKMEDKYRKGSKEIFDIAIHKTGYSSSLIINREIFLKVLDQDIQFQGNLWKLYPQSYITFLMSTKGNMVMLKQVNFVIREIENSKSNKIENIVNGYKPYFTMESRYGQILDWLGLIESTDMDVTVKSKLIIDMKYEMADMISQYYWLLHKNPLLKESGIYRQYKVQFDADKLITKKEWVNNMFSYLYQLKDRNYNKNVDILIYELKKIVHSFYLILKLLLK